MKRDAVSGPGAANAGTPGAGAQSPADEVAWARAVASALVGSAPVLAPVPMASDNWRPADAPVTAARVIQCAPEGTAIDGGERAVPDRLVLRCHDDALGNIDVRVERTTHGLSIDVAAERGAQELLQAERSALGRALEARGLTVVSVSIGRSASASTRVGTAVATALPSARARVDRAGGKRQRKLDIVG